MKAKIRLVRQKKWKICHSEIQNIIGDRLRHGKSWIRSPSFPEFGNNWPVRFKANQRKKFRETNLKYRLGIKEHWQRQYDRMMKI